MIVVRDQRQNAGQVVTFRGGLKDLDVEGWQFAGGKRLVKGDAVDEGGAEFFQFIAKVAVTLMFAVTFESVRGLTVLPPVQLTK